MKLALAAQFLLAAALHATTFNVGPFEQYKDFKELPVTIAAGDVVEVQPGIYSGARAWPIAGTPASPIDVHCTVDYACIVDGAGVNLQFTPRAMFEVPGGSYRFAGFKVKSASNGANAAAFRCIAGQCIIERNWIRNCDMGIHSTAPTLMVIRNNDIGWNGRGANSHNIYLSGGDISITEDNRVDHTIGGQNMHIRTRLAYVRRNYIANSVDGEVTFVNGPLTLQPGSDAFLEDNTIVTMATGRNNCCRVIAFGHEGVAGTDRKGTLWSRRNKFTIKRPDQIVFSLDSVNAALDGNDDIIIGAPTTVVRQRYGTSGPITGNDFPDTTPPTQPTNLTATQTARTIHLSWTPSLDASGIDHYEVTAPYGPFSMGEEPAYDVVAGLYVGRSYTFSVIAVDKAGNRSVKSDDLVVIRQ